MKKNVFFIVGVVVTAFTVVATVVALAMSNMALAWQVLTDSK